MYNPPNPNQQPNQGAYYRQPNSTPGVGAPTPSPNYGAPMPPGQPQQPGGYPQQPQQGLPQQPQQGLPPQPQQPGGYPQQPQQGLPPPPPTQAAGQYNQPPPPQAAGQYGQPMAAGQYGAPVPPSGGMGISLQKNEQISLTKEDPSLRKVTVGLGWDVNTNPAAPFDLDAVVFMLAANGRVRSSQDFIFYNNKQSRDGGVIHHGDNLTGQGEGDDEVVTVNLQQVAPDITRLVFAVSIHQPEQRRQNFSMVPRAFIRIANQESGRNICRYDLQAEAGQSTAMIVGEVFRGEAGQWSFVAVGKGFGTPGSGPTGLPALLGIFGC